MFGFPIVRPEPEMQLHSILTFNNVQVLVVAVAVCRANRSQSGSHGDFE